jgi:ABC-type transport system substrate-binding protein
MNRIAVLVVLIILILAVIPAAAEPADPPDTLFGQYLFANATEAFVKCNVELRLNDSIVALALGEMVSAKPPIWSFSYGDSNVSYRMGDTVLILRYTLPRRALDVTALTNRALWDPVAVGYEVPYAALGLVHRWLFKLTPEGAIKPDLAREWYWQGHDLFVILDSTQTFGDDTPIDAYRVKSSVERYLWYQRDTSIYNWQSRIAGVGNYRKGQVNHVVGLIPRHRDTLQISMSRPNFELPSRFAAPRTAIVKWSRTEDAAPVVATAGHYSLREGRTLKGRRYGASLFRRRHT